MVSNAASFTCSKFLPSFAALAAKTTAKPSCIQLDRESTLSIWASACFSKTISFAIWLVDKVPLISDDKKIQHRLSPVSYTHLRAHETRHDLVCRLLLEKKK